MKRLEDNKCPIRAWSHSIGPARSYEAAPTMMASIVSTVDIPRPHEAVLIQFHARRHLPVRDPAHSVRILESRLEQQRILIRAVGKDHAIINDDLANVAQHRVFRLGAARKLAATAQFGNEFEPLPE